MENTNLMKIYIEQLNSYHLPQISYPKLDMSCNGGDCSYAKEILKNLHDAFTDVYGTDCLDDSHEFVLLPAVVKGKNTGHVGLALLEIDMESSGEHWGTHFLTPMGVIEQGGESLTSIQKQYLSDQYIPYEYWYTADIPQDIHLNGTPPIEVKEILSACVPEQPQMEMQ